MAFRVKQSGGFWSGVDGTIVGYKFSTRAPAKGGKEGDETDWVHLVPSILVDGKQQPDTQHMKLGNVSEWTVSDDGLIATAADGNNDPRWVTGDFLGTLANAASKAGVDAQLPDTEAGEPLYLVGIVGLRVRLEQQKDEKSTAKMGKRTGKNGKGEYDRTNTIVTKVYGRVEQASSQKGTASSAKGSARPATKSNGNAAQIDLDAKARDIVLNLLAEAKGATTKNKIRVPAINLTASNAELAPYRVELQTRILDDAFLANINGVRYDKASGALSLEQ